MQQTQVQLLGQEDPLEKGRHGNPLQYSCLENTVDRGACLAAVHGGRRVRHNLSNLACTHSNNYTFPTIQLEAPTR